MTKALLFQCEESDNMPKPQKIMYKGEEYPSLTALCDKHDIMLKTVQYRLDIGWSLEDALTIPTSRIKIEYDGKKYNSLKEFSDVYEMPYSILSHHYYKTQDISSALERTLESISKNKPMLWGKEFDSYQSIATEYGISVSKLIASIQKGNCIEDSVMDLLENSTITFNGKEYGGIRDICADYSIQPITVYNRIKSGMSMLRAITKPIKKVSYGNTVEYRNKKYTSEVSLCRDYGISTGMIREQLRNHSSLSFKDVFDVFVRLKEHCNIPTDTQINIIPYCIINGNLYNTLSEFSKTCGITTSSILSFKCRMGVDDLIDTLKLMQAKTVPRYIVNGQLYASKELKAMGYSTTTIKSSGFEKIYVPLYSSLQKYDFNYECYDTNKIYLEYLTDAEKIAFEQIEDDVSELCENEGFELSM